MFISHRTLLALLTGVLVLPSCGPSEQASSRPPQRVTVATSSPQAGYDLLAAIAGEYTYEYQEVGAPARTGTTIFRLLTGGRFLTFEERSIGGGDGDTMDITGIVGYDSVGGYFTWYRAFENGAYDHARGTLQDGTITFDITDSRWEPFDDTWGGPGRSVRTVWTVSEEGLKTFIWERSVNGGPWEHLAEGRTTRVR